MKLLQVSLAAGLIALTCNVSIQAKVKEVTSMDEFDQIIESKPFVVVKFWMKGCPPCEALKPHFETVSSDAGCKKVIFLAVKGPSEISEEYGINSFPTVLYFKDGEKVGKGNARKPAELRKEIKSKFGL